MMSLQETVLVKVEMIFTTEEGEVPDLAGFERLISEHLAGELDERTGLECMVVKVVSVSGELD
jgi:hypothetical protein